MIDALTTVAIALLLFHVTNWIGKHSYQSGYFEIGQLSRSSGSTAFNYAYRVFAPIAVLVVIAAASLNFGLTFVSKSLLSGLVAYFLLRIAYYLISDRMILVNKIEFTLIMASTISIYYWIDKELVKNNDFLIPTRQEIGTAIWLAIAAFIYKTINSIGISEAKAQKRRKHYVKNQKEKYLSRYGDLINELSKCQTEANLLIAVMIYEGLNRPRLYQAIERAVLPFKGKATIGPMQVTTTSNITDEQSVRLGAEKLLTHYRSLKEVPDRSEWFPLDEALTVYNGSSSYAVEVREVLELLSQEA